MKENNTVTENKRMLSAKEACVYLGMGENKTRSFLDEIGVSVRIGHRVLYDRKRIDEYLDNLGK